MELLEKLKYVNRRLAQLQERYTALETKLGPHSPELYHTKVQSSPTDLVGMLLAVLADVSVEIDKVTARKEDLVAELGELITRADLDPDELIVIRLRYIYGAKWYDIADSMYLSPRYVYKIHGEALEKLRGVANETD